MPSHYSTFLVVSSRFCPLLLLQLRLSNSRSLRVCQFIRGERLGLWCRCCFFFLPKFYHLPPWYLKVTFRAFPIMQFSELSSFNEAQHACHYCKALLLVLLSAKISLGWNQFLKTHHLQVKMTFDFFPFRRRRSFYSFLMIPNGPPLTWGLCATAIRTEYKSASTLPCAQLPDRKQGIENWSWTATNWGTEFGKSIQLPD